MHLYMKQKVFSLKDKFTIKDPFGEDKYFVEGKMISFGKKLHILDAAGNELAFVRQIIFTFMPKFAVEIDGQQVAMIKKKISFFKPKYVIDGVGWEIQGDFLGHDYMITENGAPIVSIHKKWMAWGDTFELDIADESKEVLAVAVVLAIDAVMDSQSSSTVSFNSND